MSEIHQRAREAAPEARGTDAQGAGDGQPQPAQAGVSDPAGLIRIATMTQAMTEEVRNTSLDDAGVRHLTQVHRRAVEMVKQALSEELREELSEFVLPLGDGQPSEDELRVAQAQLTGWLDGLFRGIQAAIVSQQLGAQQQLRQLRRPQALGPQGRQEQERPGQSAYL